MSEASGIPIRDRLRLRPYRPGDEERILASYNQIFTVPRSLAHWHWKFRDNPVGEYQISVAEDTETGDVVGHYAGIPLATWMEGVRAKSAQIVDLVVLPAWRRHGGRPGLFAQVGRFWIDSYIDEQRGQNVFAFGWPVPAWRAGQKYLSYLNVRDWDLLFRETGAGFEPRAAPAALAVEPVARFGPDVDALWQRMQGELKLAVVRDARYLNWRYADHPDVRYTLLECREVGSGALRGIAVYGAGDWPRPNTGCIVDWLAPAADADVMQALLAACEREAARGGVDVLTTIFNHVDPRFLQFQRAGFLVLGTSYFVVIKTTPRLDTVYYRDHWYLTPGDSDLV
ncbi:MAG: GNAT family N-acetyltransferase [Planctomycetota bacterium]